VKILVLNCGSSSIKCTLFEMPDRAVLAQGTVEKIGEEDTVITFRSDGEILADACSAADHPTAVDTLLRRFLKANGGVLDDLDEIAAFGHRVVHGGEVSESMVVDESVLDIVRRAHRFAPLHNPPNLAGLEAALRAAPGKPQVAVFDTAFHAHMPPEAYLYALPLSLYEEHQVRVYGFHGTSFRYVSRRAADFLGIPPDKVNLITIHLGNGCSMAAVRNGRSVDTSMGMTPLQGLVMGTRSGDIDPSLFLFLGEWLDLTPEEVYDLFNRQSGLLGLSGLSNDVRELQAAARDGNERAALALRVFSYRVRKYIGAYFAVLGRVDGIIFTAGIGENSSWIRAMACDGLDGLGVALDPARNESTDDSERSISAAGSAVPVLVIPTDEARQIAVETYNILKEDIAQ